METGARCGALPTSAMRLAIFAALAATIAAAVLVTALAFELLPLWAPFAMFWTGATVWGALQAAKALRRRCAR